MILGQDNWDALGYNRLGFVLGLDGTGTYFHTRMQAGLSGIRCNEGVRDLIIRVGISVRVRVRARARARVRGRD